MENFETSPEESRLESPNKGFHFSEISQLEVPMILALEKAKKKIRRGAYDVLLSDDVGARVPTLVINKLLKKYTAEGERPPTFFLSAGRSLTTKDETGAHREEVKKFIAENIKPKIKKRALVITEYVETGDSIRALAKILEEEGVSFDVMVLVSNKEELSLIPEHLVFLGVTPKTAQEHNWKINQQHVIVPPEIYNSETSKKITGVSKSLQYSFLDKRYYGAYPATAIGLRHGDKDAQDNVSYARKDIEILASKFERILEIK